MLQTCATVCTTSLHSNFSNKTCCFKLQQQLACAATLLQVLFCFKGQVTAFTTSLCCLCSALLCSVYESCHCLKVCPTVVKGPISHKLLYFAVCQLQTQVNDDLLVLTLCVVSLQAHVAAKAAEIVADHSGISCEVLDLRTLMPWDLAAVSNSVKKTGRLIVTHEAPHTGGFGAEIVAAIAERNGTFLRLEAPPLRVCGLDTPFPLVFEPLYLPGVERLVEAILATARY